MESHENKEGIPVEPKPENGFSRREFLEKLAMGTVGLAITPASALGDQIPRNTIEIGQIGNEQFIKEQVAEIEKIIREEKYREILANPYLTSALYYSKEFLLKVGDPSDEHFVPERILDAIRPMISTEFRKNAMKMLAEETQRKEIAESKKVTIMESSPLKKFDFGHGVSHPDAIDLFAEESSPIYSLSGGLVIVAESKWGPEDELSSSSIKGGNTVIVYNYITNEFCRYAHLDTVHVNTGELIESGHNIGTVGHTGTNASLPGRGKHLHLEINKYISDSGTNIALSDVELKKRLQRLMVSSLT